MGAATSGPVDVLVIGAGPTGLTLAVQLRTMGATVRVVDKLPGPRRRAPALALHPRTLEVLAGLGLAEPLIERGVSRVDLRLHFPRSEVRGRLDDLGFDDTPFPFILFVPQPSVEEALRDRLATLGAEVEWDKRFDSFSETADGVTGRVLTARGEEAIIARYLVGCDGVTSVVRNRAGIGFPGRPYRQTLLVGDVEPLAGVKGQATDAFFGAEGILFLFPLPSGQSRLIVVRPATLDTDDPTRVIEEHVAGLLGPEDLVWTEYVRPQRRVARHFRRGRVFLAGDAAHVHSPAGAQGMNTGIQDSVNLGWRLALAASGAEGLVDGYEKERRPVAIRNIVITEAAFMLEASARWPFRLARTVAGPPVARLVTKHPAIVRRVARFVSGLDVTYRVAGGRRAPERGLPTPGKRLLDSTTSETAGGLHGTLSGSSFHLFSFGTAPNRVALGAMKERYGGLVEHHHFAACPWPARATPLNCLVRPDGYIAAWSGPDLVEVSATLERMTGDPLIPVPATPKL